MQILSYGTEGIEEIEYSVYSDYSGCIVEKTNFEYLKKELDKYKGFYILSGGYGTMGIGYNPAELTKQGKNALEEILESLEKYPCLNDDLLSELEFDLVQDTIVEFREVYKKQYHIEDIDTFNRVAFDYFYGCNKYSNFVDYCESDAVKTIAQELSAKTNLQYTIDSLYDNENSYDDIIIALIEEFGVKNLLSACLDSMNYTEIAELLKNNLHNYQIDAIKENL